jgi:hypothetical protein
LRNFRCQIGVNLRCFVTHFVYPHLCFHRHTGFGRAKKESLFGSSPPSEIIAWPERPPFRRGGKYQASQLAVNMQKRAKKLQFGSRKPPISAISAVKTA